MPRAAAKLAVGHPFEADLLLHPDRIADRRIFDAAQFLARETAGLMLGSRPQQLRRTQQAADMVGAEGWTRHRSSLQKPGRRRRATPGGGCFAVWGAN